VRKDWWNWGKMGGANAIWSTVFHQSEGKEEARVIWRLGRALTQDFLFLARNLIVKVNFRILSSGKFVKSLFEISSN